MKNYNYIFLVFLLFGCTSNKSKRPIDSYPLLYLYVFHTPQNSLYEDSNLEIKKNNTIVFNKKIDLGHHIFQDLKPSKYSIAYSLNPIHKEYTTIQLNNPDSAYFVSIRRHCREKKATINLEAVLPKAKLSARGKIQGVLDIEFLKYYLHTIHIKDKALVPTVRFYNKDTIFRKKLDPLTMQDKIDSLRIFNYKIDSISLLPLPFEIDSIPVGFYQGAVEIDPFSSPIIFKILVKPELSSIVDFKYFDFSKTTLEWNHPCFEQSYEIWNPAYTE